MLSREDKGFILNGIRYIEARGGADILTISAALPILDPNIVRKLTNHALDEARHAAMLTHHMVESGFTLRPTEESDDYVAKLDLIAELGDDYEISLVKVLTAANVVERRALWLFRQFAQTLDDAPDTLAIFRKLYADEVRHVTWTTDALGQLERLGMADDLTHTFERLFDAEERAFHNSYLTEIVSIIGHDVGPSGIEPYPSYRIRDGIAPELATLTRA
jgi:hypothetical protein